MYNHPSTSWQFRALEPDYSERDHSYDDYLLDIAEDLADDWLKEIRATGCVDSINWHWPQVLNYMSQEKLALIDALAKKAHEYLTLTQWD